MATGDPPPGPRRPAGAGWGAGAVTRLGTAPPAPAAPTGAPPGAAGSAGATPPAGTDRRRLLLFGGIAGALLAAGLAIVLAVTFSGGVDPLWDRPAPAADVRPPLARACPPPTDIPPDQPGTAAPSAPPAPAPSGPRTVDEAAGISYKAYGAPWEEWTDLWRGGTLDVAYKVGQHFVTEVYPEGSYHASILSAAVPAAENDALVLDLECVGRQVAADVRTKYYPEPNQIEPLRDSRVTLGGLPAWVTVFRLRFSRPGLRAKDELAAVATIDVGRPDAAILYVSIPGTHRQFDYVVDDVLASVRRL